MGTHLGLSFTQLLEANARDRCGLKFLSPFTGVFICMQGLEKLD